MFFFICLEIGICKGAIMAVIIC